MITDYDCWHPEHAWVTLEEIIGNLNRNAESACNVIRQANNNWETKADAIRPRAGRGEVTDAKLVPAAARRRLAAIIGKYMP